MYMYPCKVPFESYKVDSNLRLSWVSQPEDQWSFKRSPDFFPVITTTVKQEKGQHQFFRCSRAANSVVHDQIWPNFKLIKALIYVIITCKYEKDLIKNS